MNKCFLMMVLLGFLAAPTLAELQPGDRSSYQVFSGDAVQSAPIYGGSVPRAFSGPVYSNMEPGPNGYAAFPAITGALGADDYDSVNNETITLDNFSFIGGVENAGETLYFEFFNPDETFAEGFAVELSQGGNYIYTINGGLNTPIGIALPDAGILLVSTDEFSTGQWFLGDSGPTIGWEDVSQWGGGGGQFSHNFELTNVPEPATSALMIFGALALLRRRL